MSRPICGKFLRYPCVKSCPYTNPYIHIYAFKVTIQPTICQQIVHDNFTTTRQSANHQWMQLAQTYFVLRCIHLSVSAMQLPACLSYGRCATIQSVSPWPSLTLNCHVMLFTYGPCTCAHTRSFTARLAPLVEQSLQCQVTLSTNRAIR